MFHLATSGKGKGYRKTTSLMDQEFQINTKWDEVICPICLDFPHNGVLLQCSSYHKGCRPFVCDTNHLHSNCFNRFKIAHGMMTSPLPPSSDPKPSSNLEEETISDENCKPYCPLCRGEVTGWVIVDSARVLLDQKKRCCEEQRCSFSGTFSELEKHAQFEHPHSRPSEIDPARKLDWENFQQSSDIIDVLSTIYSEVPRGVVLGDYVIEYENDQDAIGDDFEEYSGRAEGNWWTSCIFYQVFNNLRNSRNRRRRSRRVGDSRRRGVTGRVSYDISNSDDGSVISGEYRVDENDEELVNTGTRGDLDRRSYRRRGSSRFQDN